MMRVLYAECLKYRRTVVPWLVLISPLAAAAISCDYVGSHRLESTAWPNLFFTANGIWSALWIPFGWGLTAGLAGEMEVSAGRWRSLRARELAPSLYYMAKACVLALFALASCVLLWGFLLIAGGILHLPAPMPVGTFALCMGVNWLGSLPWLWTALWLAEGTHWGVPVGFGAIGMLTAAIIGGEFALGNNIWPFIPWAWPSRFVLLMYAMLTPELRGPTVQLTFWSVLGAAVVLSIIVLVLGTWWFHRRDVL